MGISSQNQDRLIYVIYFIVIATPFLMPISLPLGISESTQMFYDEIHKIPDGGTIMWCTDIAFYHWNEIGSGQVAILKELFTFAQERDVKIVLITFWAEGIAITDRIMNTWLIPEGFLDGLTYGEDWVDLGYIPGMEAAMAAVAEDIHEAARTDKNGTPIDQLTIMDNIHTLSDFELVGWGGTRIDEYARQWTGKGVPLIVNMGAWGISAAVAWFEQGLVVGYLNGNRGCAEFEKLTGYPGLSTASIDSQSLNHLYAVLLLLFANTYWILKGGRWEPMRKGES